MPILRCDSEESLNRRCRRWQRCWAKSETGILAGPGPDGLRLTPGGAGERPDSIEVGKKCMRASWQRRGRETGRSARSQRQDNDGQDDADQKFEDGKNVVIGASSTTGDFVARHLLVLFAEVEVRV